MSCRALLVLVGLRQSHERVYVSCWSFWGLIDREVKHDVYGKRKTAKMKLLSSLFCGVHCRVKLFVSSKRRYYISVGFIYGLEEKNWKSEVVFTVCRLSLTMLNLSNRSALKATQLNISSSCWIRICNLL